MNEQIIFIIFIIVSCILVALAHENDIIRMCLLQGDSGYATWTTKIKCEVIK